MRVYYSSEEFIDFPNATHWESVMDDWVELSNDDGEIQAVINWKFVWLIRPLTVITGSKE